MKTALQVVLISSMLSLFSCGEEVITPKPRGYYRIELPERKYSMFDPAGCTYKFEIADYIIPVPDTNRLSESCWWYLVMPKINGQIYLTYKPLHGDINKFLDDTHTLVYKHTSRASSIDEQVISFRPGVSGVLYTLGGQAASSTQFYVTDSVHHFLRGAVYFNAPPNADSLAPVQSYVREDILHMLKTLEWK
ncbi:MAG: gliding motility lipoprotein GldD [Bacteroidetes bacterium]|nr:gliding motility lipoprotein GldD [Bacteroidota bacterium]